MTHLLNLKKFLMKSSTTYWENFLSVLWRKIDPCTPNLEWWTSGQASIVTCICPPTTESSTSCKTRLFNWQTQHSEAYSGSTSKQGQTPHREELQLNLEIWSSSTQIISTSIRNVYCISNTKSGLILSTTLGEEGKKEFTYGKKIILALAKQLKEGSTST